MLLFFIVFLPLLTSCREAVRVNKNTQALTDSIVAQLQDGDLVLRAGKDFTSEMIKAFNIYDKRFSHCGIVFVEGVNLMVYHSIGAESAPNEPIKKETINLFFAAQNNNAIGYSKMQLSDEEKNRLKFVLDSFYHKKIPFDMRFDLKTNDSMYCSEMVAKALQESVSDIQISTTDTFSKQYINIESVAHNSRSLKVIYAKY